MDQQHVIEIDGRRVAIVHAQPGKPGRPQRAAEAPDAALPRYMRRVRTKGNLPVPAQGVRPPHAEPVRGGVPAAGPPEVAAKVGGVTPAERNKAKDVLDAIGSRFAENRRKSKSEAYVIYQRDLAENAHFLIAGGLMSLKELSELFLRLEEHRKADHQQGKSAATFLAEWLSGGGPEIPA